MDRTQVTLIRPLVLTSEKNIKRYIKKSGITVMNKVCPMDGKSKRENMKAQIVSWQKDIPMIRSNLFGAITRNIEAWKPKN